MGKNRNLLKLRKAVDISFGEGYTVLQYEERFKKEWTRATLSCMWRGNFLCKEEWYVEAGDL